MPYAPTIREELKNKVTANVFDGHRLLCLFVAAAVAAGLAPSARADVSPQDLQYETVDGVCWSFVIEDGKAKVTNQRMHTAIDASTTGAVIVPDTLGGCPVTAIGAYAFFEMTGITSLTIPEGVAEIEYYVCRGCTNLESVSLPSTLTTMGNAVFSGCKSLKAGHIPDSVTSMGRDTFAGCLSMTSVKFSSNVTMLDTMTCYNCDSLTNVVIPNSVRDIGISAFLSCDNLISVSIPNAVTNIGTYAFDNCVSLQALSLPGGLLAVNSSFNSCKSLASVRIPANVLAIAPKAFLACSSLTNFEVDPANTAFKSVDGILYDITGTELVAWPYGLSPVTIPSGVKRIGDAVFAHRYDIASIVFPEGLETIGASAFEICKQLSAVVFPASLKSIGERAFYHCTALTSATFGEGIETVEERAFEKTAIQSVVLPQSTTAIDQYAFYNCSQLSSLEVSSSNCRIGERAFDNCPKLQSIHIARGADVSVLAFGYPIDDPTDDDRDVLWACDFNKGVVGEDIRSDCYADGHVVIVEDETRTEIVADNRSGRTYALLESPPEGECVWFSANKVSDDCVGDAIAPARGQKVTLSFNLSSIALCDPGDEPRDETQGTVFSLDDKLFLRCCEDDEDNQGYVWQVSAGVRDKDGTIVERTVALASSDDSLDLPDLAENWGEVRIEVINHIPADGLAFRIYFDRVLAMAESGGTVFRARPSAEDKAGVAALGIAGTAAVDDIVFSLDNLDEFTLDEVEVTDLDEDDPLSGVTLHCDSGRLKEVEKKTLAGIVRRAALRGVSDLWLDPAKGEPDEAPLTCVQLGISPVSRETFKSRMTLYFKNPTVEITGFDPAARVVTGRIVPAQGTSIVQPPMDYMFGLTKIGNFGTAKQYPKEFGDPCSRNEDGFSVDLSHYMTSNGMFSLAFPANIAQDSSAFFTVTVKPYAGRRKVK